jgi:competence protein CoiA
MPPFESFRDAESYYSTLAHECTHWTRHPARLEREFGRKRWGDEGYAMEDGSPSLNPARNCRSWQSDLIYWPRWTDEQGQGMPLRCLDGHGQSVRASDFMPEEWQALALENRRLRHLRMPCCDAQVVLKTSPRGIRFFAHKAKGACTSAPESEAHLFLKQMIVNAARAHGWEADTEIAGQTPSGGWWKADVLAQKGKHRVAVEVQWSGQTPQETLRRQEQYRESGIRGLWLLRQPGFPVAQALPAVCVGGSLEDGFTALIPGCCSDLNARDRAAPARWRQSLPMEDFLGAVFCGRFRFGAPLDMEAMVSIWGAPDSCWSCGAQTLIVARVEINFGPNAPYFSLSDFGEHRELVPVLLDNLPALPDLGAIKYRASKTMGGTYLSNGCAHCGVLYGDFFAFRHNIAATALHRFPIRITPAWKRAIEERDGASWGVYSRSSLRS